MGGLLKADLTGHGHFSQIERKGLNVCALLLRSALKSRCSSIISTIRHSISENKFLIGFWIILSLNLSDAIESNYGYLSVFQTITSAYHVQT